MEALAERLGIGERHLRRLFLQHLGASPITVAQTRRVLFAKQLIHETQLPITDVALAAADELVRIPMVPGVDSLNVATAAAVAFHSLNAWDE